MNREELTFMQPTIVVVSAELYCVQSTMEYIKINLRKDKVSSDFPILIYISIISSITISLEHKSVAP